MGAGNPGIPGSGYRLSSDPLLAPQPWGSPGMHGYYTRGTVVEPYYRNESIWLPLDRDQICRLPVSDWEVDLDAEDIDGNATFDSAYSDGTSIVTFVNKGAGGNAAGANGTDPRYLPFYQKYRCNGRNAALFDGNISAMSIAGSAANGSLGTITGSGAFEIFVVFSADSIVPAMTLFGNGTGSPDESIALQVDASTTNRFSMTMTKNGGTPLFWSAPAGLTYIPGRNQILNIHANGTSIFGSIDDLAESTQAYAGGGLGTGTMTRDLKIGAGHITGTSEGNYWRGSISRVLIRKTELTKWQRLAVKTELKKFFSGF